MGPENLFRGKLWLLEPRLWRFPGITCTEHSDLFIVIHFSVSGLKNKVLFCQLLKHCFVLVRVKLTGNAVRVATFSVFCVMKIGYCSENFFLFSTSEPIKNIIKQLEEHHEKEKQGECISRYNTMYWLELQLSSVSRKEHFQLFSSWMSRQLNCLVMWSVHVSLSCESNAGLNLAVTKVFLIINL